MSGNQSSQAALQVFIDQKVVFISDGNWLYPLFDLAEFIETHPISLAQALVRDKVVGKAAALLLVRLGAGRIHAALMSELAVEVLTHFKVPHTYDQLVPRIDCQTEALLLEIDDPETAYQLLCKRAGRC
jgi:zinc transport system ATP-binding protein